LSSAVNVRAEARTLHRGLGVFVVFNAWAEARTLHGSFGAFVVFEAGEGVVGKAGGVARLGLGESGDFAREDEFAVRDEGHAVGGGKTLGTFTNKINVRRLLKDEAGGLDWVAQSFDTGDAAGFHAAAIHKKSVELDAAVGGEKAATAGVKGGVIFEDGNGGFDGVDCETTAREDGVTSFEGAADAGLVGFGCVGGDCPCAAMDKEDGIADGGGWHGVMVPQAAAVEQTRPTVRQGKGEMKEDSLAGGFGRGEEAVESWPKDESRKLHKTIGNLRG